MAGRRLTDVRARVAGALGRLVGPVFGDGVGATIFLGALMLFATTWRVEVLVSDTDTVANTMVAVADGRLFLTEFPYGLAQNPRTPGMHRLRDRFYGRNYGHVVLSLPAYWLLATVARAADLGLAIVVGWSLAVWGFAAGLARQVDRTRLVRRTGAAVATGLLVVNVVVLAPPAVDRVALAALQLSTMAAAALTGVVLYRLLASMYDVRVGVAAGVAGLVATPVWFWSTLPKRHSLTALLALLALFLLYRSRAADGLRDAVRFRALAYVPVGLTAWVHAPEGLLLLVALAPVDLATARRNRPRDLLVVGTVAALALVPMLVTNLEIAGNPFVPPRALPGVEHGGTVAGPTDAAGDPRVGSSGGTVAAAFARASTFVTYMARSATALTDPHTLFRVFVRSGLALGLHPYGTRSVNLAVLEAMPLAGTLLSLPAVLYRERERIEAPSRGALLARLRSDPGRAADLFAVAYLALLVVMYLPRLPTHVMFTVRYLHPLYPIAVYLVARLPAVRQVLRTEWRLLGGAYAAFVTLGGAALVVGLSLVATDLSSAVQLHARVGVAAAAVVLYWAVADALSPESYARGGALALAFAAAVSTTYAVLAALVYFPFTEPYALPVVRAVAEALVLW